MTPEQEPSSANDASRGEAGAPAPEKLAAALRRCQDSLERAEQANGRAVARALAASEQAAQLERTLRAEIDRLESERAALQAELASVLASTSWRLTAPLRAAVIRARRLAGRS